jgi:hypothetical protein
MVFGSRSSLKVWSSEELRLLRALADEGMPLDAIAARLRRSISAVRNKAGMHGISLAMASRRAAAMRGEARRAAAAG